jgi:hypothetical protein
MEKKLLKSGYISVGNTRYKTNFFQTIKPDDQVGYSFEVIFGNYDKIIFDDDELSGLKKKIRQLLPIAHYSRVVAKMSIPIK